MQSFIDGSLSDVAPLVGAWIEMIFHGLSLYCARVAPLVGAWIEIWICIIFSCRPDVAPLVGAWIEMLDLCEDLKEVKSLPSWERGLK